jgi:predicted nuclease of predicted toxin-antitoxin system
VRFFVDNNIALRLSRGFNEFVNGEHEFMHLRQKFPADAPDVKWMHDLTRESNWVIISGDIAIRKNPHEVAA